MMFSLFRKMNTNADDTDFILPVGEQIRAWRRANRKMKWGIGESEFAAVGPPPTLSPEDRKDGFVGGILSYGFGQDGQGNADAVLSGQMAWAFARRRRRNRTWQCQYLDFDRADCFRLRPAAPRRPRGFYFTKFRPGDRFLHWTVARFLKHLSGDTGCGPEGIQLLAVTHPHAADLMNERKIAFMAFADYEVAPYGFNDFYDALQMFCSNDVLGLGIGNVDRNYPMFGIPTLRLEEQLKAQS
jgi:hypothetical protein